MKPVEIVGEIFGGDTSFRAEECLEPFVAAVDRLDMQVATDALAGAQPERLMTDAESGGAGRIAGAAVGHQQRIFAQHRFEDGSQAGRRDGWQDRADGHAGAVHGHQDWRQFVRQAALCGLSASLAGLAAKVSLAFAAGQHKSFIGFDNAGQLPGAALERLQPAMSPADAVLTAIRQCAAAARTVSPSAIDRPKSSQRSR